MSVEKIDVRFLYNMLLNGYRNLALREKEVNDLNVFPVPDGDTGTNMVKTLGGGNSLNIEEYDSVSSMMKQFSKSVLLSARGNSGVILSQYIRGWAKAMPEKRELLISDIKEMLKMGVESAYSAVPKAVEGTMLTVLRESYEAVESNGDFANVKELFEFLTREMNVSLQNTPNLLPVLKEAGVVDSGGMGVLYFIEGIWAYLNGEIIEIDSKRESSIAVLPSRAFGADSVLEYGYCTEFVLQLMNAKTNISTFSIKNVITYMETIGDSVVAVLDDDIVKVHVHTFTPEKALAFARNYGEFISVKIENMSIQHNETNQNKPEAMKKIQYAIIAVAMGDGIKDYFAEIGANRIIEGGQTQNPSIQEFLDAFNSVNAEHIVVLPNNSNIYATAKQAADMYEKCPVHVIETKSVSEGYSALSMMNTWATNIDSFISDMTSGLEFVISVSVTKAIRDVTLNGVEIEEGKYMGIANGDVLCTSDDKNDVVLELLKNIPDIEERAVITIFYGEDVTAEEAELLNERILSEYPDMECGVISGKQKIYDYYMAIE